MTDTTLYISDLDGTLLDDNSQITRTSASLLNSAIARGALFSIATARTPATAVTLLRDINIGLPLIVMAGAAMWLPSDKKYIHVTGFEKSEFDSILQILNEADIYPLIYQIQGNQTHVYHKGKLHPAEQAFISERLDCGKIFHLDSDDYEYKIGSTVIFFTMCDYDKLEPVHRQFKEKHLGQVNLSHYLFDNRIGELEIYPSGTSKSRAIAQLASETGAKKVVVFGDNVNDIDMMRNADLSVAVSNAIEPVKQLADVIIGPNTTDSVAHFIHDNIFNNKTR